MIRKFIFWLTALLLMAVPFILKGQHGTYYPCGDTAVQHKLDEWGRLKFGLLMHWGTYSQWGIVESWSLCPEDEDWCKRRGPYAGDYYTYKKEYEKLQTTFDPVSFNPDKWALAAKEAGMRYVVFTTKHHDGFCMFDTKETDYKVTSKACPFSSDPRSNITLEIFNAFRKQGLWAGAYFSKPDWHCPDYWDPYFPPVDRNPNYDLKRYPEKWERYKQFTTSQIRELMSNYGKIDILWLDGGWVQPMTATSPRWGRWPVVQDIDMAGIAAMARSYQPGLIVVDRAVEGPYQNYLTPEQVVPDSILPYPWESCMTMATSWSYVANDTYKTPLELIRTLWTIVSRGGNFLLNIAPGPMGDWDAVAYERLQEIGAWMKVNGEAIYGSSPGFIPAEKNMVTTRGSKNELYLIVLADSSEQNIPASITCRIPGFSEKSKVNILGADAPVTWKKNGDMVQLNIPAKVRRSPPCKYAWVFRII